MSEIILMFAAKKERWWFIVKTNSFISLKTDYVILIGFNCVSYKYITSDSGYALALRLNKLKIWLKYSIFKMFDLLLIVLYLRLSNMVSEFSWKCVAD